MTILASIETKNAKKAKMSVIQEISQAKVLPMLEHSWTDYIKNIAESLLGPFGSFTYCDMTCSSVKYLPAGIS